MDFRLELLDDDTFERLANRICQDILGTGIITFAKGKDGGRDGKFTGTATSYPSKSSPWSGQFIIQAKHTNNPIGSCSDSDFKQIVDTEIKKITKLKENNEIDCYLLFTNRKYTGIKGEELVALIKTKTGVEHVAILGKETINDVYLNNSFDIIREFKLNQLILPFDFSEYEICNIIKEFKKNLPEIKKKLENREQVKYDLTKIDIKQKNKKNKLSEQYYKTSILEDSLESFTQINIFLKRTMNEDLKEQFFDISTELRNLIASQRDNFTKFEDIIVFIYKKICDGNTNIKGKRHIFTLLHFMYYECLIGRK